MLAFEVALATQALSVLLSAGSLGSVRVKVCLSTAFRVRGRVELRGAGGVGVVEGGAVAADGEGVAFVGGVGPAGAGGLCGQGVGCYCAAF